MYGWIDMALKWDNDEITINTSSVYSPYKSLVTWIENINQGKLPCQLDIDDESDIFRLKAYPVDNKELFYLIIENTYDKDNRIYLEGLFNRGEFIGEFCYKFRHFLTTEYDNEYWTDDDEDDLSKLIAGGITGGFRIEVKCTCPCCGYKTLAESGNYDLCPICYWEDDPSQYEDPDLEGGPNSPSLRQAQLNFILYGASDQECLSYVQPPSLWDIRDSTWLPLHQIQENILTLQKEFEKNRDLPVNLFKSISFLFFKKKLNRCRNEKKDIRRCNKRSQENYCNARSDALGKIKDEQIRYWLLKAESINDVEFIVKAQDSFWKWLENVKICSHLHLELITDSNGFAPLYNCRCCGAYVGCTCFFRNPNSWPVNQYISVRPSALSDFIPYRVFKEVFIRPNVCYRCRKDEDMAAPRAYGKNKIEKVYWRELFAEESKAWAFLRGKEFQTGDEIINYSKNTQPVSLLFLAILNDDKDEVIKRILDRTLYVKNRLRKIGVSASVKEILGYAVHKACYLYNNQYKRDEKKDKLIDLKEKPQTIYLPGFHSNKEMIKDLGLLENPDKIKEMSLVFKIDVLREFLIEEVSVNDKEVKTLAISQVKVFEFDPASEFQRVLDAARIKDIYLFLKTIQKIWQKDKVFLVSKKEDLSNIITDNSMEWAIVEYELFCEGNYSGFGFGLECNRDLLAWLKANVCIPKFMDMLHKGNIITNIVGMRFIEWAKYLRLDEYLNDKMVTLIREPNNQHDENAIAAETESFGRLGYIKRSVAKILAPIMDNEVKLQAEIFARYYTNETDTTIFLKMKTQTERDFHR
ncbi:MAG: HIRAN domain protein [Candidatus Brocadia sinica]|nr:MAG: HIRAN domain protein [Candidatus Brocadia sinica]